MRLIDANDVKRRGDCYPSDVRKVISNVLSHTKTVKDAVVVVRCKDCKHSFLHDNGEKISRICGRTKMCGTTKDDWFCADAERSTE